MSTFSQPTADWWAGDSPVIASICFSGGTEFTGKLSASTSPCPASDCASKGALRAPPPTSWLGPGGLAVMRKESTGPQTRYF